MPSPVERVRAAVEWCLRATLLALLAWSLARALAARGHRGVDVARSPELGAALRRWSTTRAPERVAVALDHAPAVVERDWLAALPGAGTAVEWRGSGLVPSAIAIEPRADPVASADVAVAAAAGSSIVLRDTVGVLDSITAAPASTIHAIVERPQRTIEAGVGSALARGAMRDSLGLRRLLVLGAAEWETKFAVAALEERGWPVDARFALSPRGDVVQGAIGAIDTSRYSAVLVVDSTAAPWADRVADYVRRGGGLVLWAPAARIGALARLAPGAPGTAIPDDQTAPSDSAPRRGLALAPIERLAPDAVVIERRGADITLAARRASLGRVIETGYLNSWRWRMAGGDAAPAAHRAWLAGLVASVAYTGRRVVAPPPTDAAPLATLVDRLGAPARSDVAPSAAAAPPLAAWIFALLCAAALLEWASRRLRGVR